jgi:hypothetical protein
LGLADWESAAQQPFRTPLVLSRVHWVRPELVAEVKFLTWTDDNLLRQVVYEGRNAANSADEPVPSPHASFFPLSKKEGTPASFRLKTARSKIALKGKQKNGGNWQIRSYLLNN